MEKQLKILTNVFLNTFKNNVVPVNVYYNKTIKKIEKLSSSEFCWEHINTQKKKTNIVKQLISKKIPNTAKIIDGKFNLIIPGAIDPHVHFNTPGFEFRDDFEHGSTAAAFGGVTTFIDMPCTSLPPVTSLKNFNIKLEAVKNRSLVDFAFWGGISGNDFESFYDVEKNIMDLNGAGIASYKIYLISGMDTFKDLTFEQMKMCSAYVKKTGKPLGVHAEDKCIVESRRLRYQSNNRNDWKHYCLSRDQFAEEKAISDVIKIAKFTGVHVHIVHLSSQLGLEAIKKAQAEGFNITSETCPHYLQFTQKDFENELIKNYLKTAPPVKNKTDQTAMWDGITDGTLQFVTTDHAGCNPNDEKINENFWKVYGGIPGVEHRVPYLVSEGFMKRNLSLERTVDLLSTNAAEMYNIKNKGKIKEGYDADFAIINLWESEIIDSRKMHSKGKYTPFEGMKFNCKIEKTILRGNVVMSRDGETEKEIGYGKFIEVH